MTIRTYFFNPKTDKPYQSVKRSFTTACRRAKLQNFRFHDLRHCFASFLVMRGVDIKTVQELLGHKSLTCTMRYSHLAPGHKKNAIRVLDEMVENEDPIDFGYNLGTNLEDDGVLKVANLA
ncbi:MAG: site-specific integrase [Candidatus Anammoxibacter sp.]